MIFCYGSNSIEQLAQRTESDYDDLKRRSIKASAPGYIRIFNNQSKRWGASVAGIVKTQKYESDVYGLGVFLTKSEIKIIDSFENTPVMYKRLPIQLLEKSSDELYEAQY